jgi:hypothetical protein
LIAFAAPTRFQVLLALFQRAMPLAPVTPPALAKTPPTYTSAPLRAMVMTVLLMPNVPLSSPLQVVPFQRAM